MAVMPTRILVGLLGASVAGMVALALAHDNPHEAVVSSCLKESAWNVFAGEAGRVVPASEFLAGMALREVVLLGEQHDVMDHHRWQLQTLAALHALRPGMVIGFEMFPRRLQPVLDRWVAGQLSTREFLRESEWETVWNMPADLYLPLFEFARINRIPMLALNVDRKLNRAITEGGWDAIPAEQREGVGNPAPPPEAYRDFLFQVYQAHEERRGKDAGKARKTDDDFRFFVESQTVWDRAMAEVLARQVGAGGKPLVVGVMGSGHVRYGHGVPHQLRDLGVSKVGTLLPMGAGSDCKDSRAGIADAIFALPAQAGDKPPPPRLGVRLEQKGESVVVTEVTGGSLAERTGIQGGDVLAVMAGSPVKRINAAIRLIRQQPEGTWLPIQVQRGEERIDLVVKFPATP